MCLPCLARCIAVFALLGACSSTPAEPPPTAECRAKRVTKCPTPEPTFADVEPIFRRVCRDCHALPGGPWPLESYSDIADWQDVIRDDLLTCTMPPADGGVTLADEDRQLILTWIRCGAPK